jgi:hypothetical protein
MEACIKVCVEASLRFSVEASRLVEAGAQAGLHAGRPKPDPSKVDKASGVVVFRRGGLVGNAVRHRSQPRQLAAPPSLTRDLFTVFICAGRAPHAFDCDEIDGFCGLLWDVTRTNKRSTKAGHRTRI